MTYTYEEALKDSLEYFGGNDLPAKVFLDKYALRDNDKQLLESNPDQMHKRIAKELAKVEKNKFKKPLTKSQIYEYLKGFRRIIPQGSPMYGIGNKNRYVTLSNCYVLDSPEDSYSGIMWTDEQVVQISKRRGGVGTDLSKLRPSGTTTQNSSNSSSGVISFAERFSNSIREVGQDGRRGALMLSLSVHHPDILNFVKCKSDRSKVTGANISVKLTDEFLKAVKENKEYEQRWPITGAAPEIVKMVNAREVWHEIIKNAHADAEPGLLFWDRIIKESPADCYSSEGFSTECVNPCAELPLSVLDSCRLLLLNLFSYVNNPFSDEAEFDYRRFFDDAKIAQRLMDDIIDLELEAISRIIKKIKADPEPRYLKSRELGMWERIYNNCARGRRTGTGITALGDTLAALGIKYDSGEGISTAERIYRTLKFACYEESIDLAEELGPFEVWDWRKEKDNQFIDRMVGEVCDLDDTVISGTNLVNRMSQVGRRNIALLTTAPAGSVSILTQTTSGIEPLFLPWYTRKKKGNPSDNNFRSDEVDQNGDHWMHFKVYHPKVKEWMKYREEQCLDTKFENSPWYNACANDLDWQNRVILQAKIGEHVDHSISSTINLPQNTTVEKIKEIYETAWEYGCKGITVYRDGCRTGVLVHDKEKEKELPFPEDRPKELPCDVHHIQVKGQQYFVLVGLCEDKPYEVFAGKNGFLPKKIKTGKIIRKRKNFYKAVFDDSDEELSPITATTDEIEECVTRLVSGLLRTGANMQFVVQQLEKVGERKELHSFARSVSRALKKYIPDGTSEGESCPECGGQLIRQEGCVACPSCSWSRCL